MRGAAGQRANKHRHILTRAFYHSGHQIHKHLTSSFTEVSSRTFFISHCVAIESLIAANTSNSSGQRSEDNTGARGGANSVSTVSQSDRTKTDRMWRKNDV